MKKEFRIKSSDNEEYTFNIKLKQGNERNNIKYTLKEKGRGIIFKMQETDEGLMFDKSSGETTFSRLMGNEEIPFYEIADLYILLAAIIRSSKYMAPEYIMEEIIINDKKIIF